MGLDIRLPIGLLFLILGAVLVLYGLASDASIYQRSLGYNVNVVWGLALAVFGVVMLWLARRGGARARPASESVEGRAIERMELETGKERRPED